MSQAIKPKRSKYTPKRGRPILDPERRKEFAAKRREEDRERLANAVEYLTLSDGWRQWIEVRGRFHSYSLNNTMLIASQRPEATQVAGYRVWQSVNRQVRRGEQGIRILAPMLVKEKDADGNETGEKVIFYKSVSVFDISQTEGEPLPEPPIEAIDGDSHSEYLPRLEAFATEIGYTVSYGATGQANGWANASKREIMVSDSLSPNGRVKTLTHEIAHALGIDYTDHERGEAEVIVESVAYIVCSGIGLATDGYSVGYVASWAEGDAERVRKAAETVDEVAGKIESALGIK